MGAYTFEPCAHLAIRESDNSIKKNLILNMHRFPFLSSHGILVMSCLGLIRCLGDTSIGRCMCHTSCMGRWTTSMQVFWGKTFFILGGRIRSSSTSSEAIADSFVTTGLEGFQRTQWLYLCARNAEHYRIADVWILPVHLVHIWQAIEGTRSGRSQSFGCWFLGPAAVC